MKEDIPVRVYRNSKKYDAIWYNRDYIREILCTLEGIPGKRGNIRFSENIVTFNNGIFDSILSFTITFFGYDGEIGLRFLYSALEDSRFWAVVIEDDHGYMFDESCGEIISIFSKSITISNRGSNYSEEESEDLCRCINSEIINPKWMEHINKFDLYTDISFIKVK